MTPSKETLEACKNLETATDEQLRELYKWALKEYDEWCNFIDTINAEIRHRGDV